MRLLWWQDEESKTEAEAMRRGQQQGRGGGAPGGNMPGLCSTDSDTVSLWAQRASANELLTLAEAAHTAYSLRTASQYRQGYPITAASNWCTALTHFHTLLNHWMLRAEGRLCNRPQCFRHFKIKLKRKIQHSLDWRNLCKTFLFRVYHKKVNCIINKEEHLEAVKNSTCQRFCKLSTVWQHFSLLCNDFNLYAIK